MKKLDFTGPLHAGYYRIDSEEEYEQAIVDYLTTHGHKPKDWGMYSVFNLSELVQGHRIKGNRESSAQTYPYVLCINFDDMFINLIVNFIPKIAFD